MVAKNGREISCKQCAKLRYFSKSKLDRKFCGQDCYSKYQETHPSNTGRTWLKKGNKPSNYKNGLSQRGYEVIYIDNKRYFVHRLEWMKKSGFYHIPKQCVVHHINGNKIDNRHENLVLLPNDVHMKLHGLVKGGKARLAEV